MKNNDEISCELSYDIYYAVEACITAKEKKEIRECRDALKSLLKSLSSDKLRAVRCECFRAAIIYDKAIFYSRSALGTVCSVSSDILTERGEKKTLPDNKTETADDVVEMINNELLGLEEQYNHYYEDLLYLIREYPDAVAEALL